jgi:hypothetical protein
MPIARPAFPPALISPELDDAEDVALAADINVEYIMQPGRFEKRASIDMEGGKAYKIRIDTLSTVSPPPPPPAFQIAPQATQVGFFEGTGSVGVTELEELARSSDISIVFTGNTKHLNPSPSIVSSLASVSCRIA